MGAALTFAAALLLPRAVAAQAAKPRPFYEMAEPQIENTLKAIHQHKHTLQARVEAVSERFLGTRYRLGPLGEGSDGEFDRDPLYRFDAVDCTTFVEEVMALSLRPDLKRALDTLRRIRYDRGRIGFSSRNHFPETDWIARNVQAGYLRDITRLVAGDKTAVAAKTISKRQWYARLSTTSIEGAFTQAERKNLLPKLRDLGQNLADERAVLPVLPIEELPRALARIPSGAIVNLVRADQPDKPVLVSHQALIVKKGGQAFVRHAASGKAVMDVPALEYFSRYNDSSWPLVGLNLNEIRDPGPGGPP